MLGNSECYPLLPIRLKGGHVNRQGQYYGMTVAVQDQMWKYPCNMSFRKNVFKTLLQYHPRNLLNKEY